MLAYLKAAYKNYVHALFTQVCVFPDTGASPRCRFTHTSDCLRASSVQKLLARHTPSLQQIGGLDARGLTVIITGPTR